MRLGSRQIKLASNTSASPQVSSNLEFPFQKGTIAAESTMPLAKHLSPAATTSCSSTD